MQPGLRIRAAPLMPVGSEFQGCDFVVRRRGMTEETQRDQHPQSRSLQKETSHRHFMISVILIPQPGFPGRLFCASFSTEARGAL